MRKPYPLLVSTVFAPVFLFHPGALPLEAQPPAPGAMNIQQAVDAALGAYPAIRISEEQIAAAEADLAAARTLLIQAQQATEVDRATVARFSGVEPASVSLRPGRLLTTPPKAAIVDVAEAQRLVTQAEIGALSSKCRLRMATFSPAAKCLRGFLIRSLRYLDGRTLSPFPVEAEQSPASTRAAWPCTWRALSRFSISLSRGWARRPFRSGHELRLADADRGRRARHRPVGLTKADVARSVVPETSSSRFTEPNYWRDSRSGNAFQIQVQTPQNRLQSIEAVGTLAVMHNGLSQRQLGQIASLKYGAMPGLIERYNGQRVVSVTANIHHSLVKNPFPTGSSSAAAARPPRPPG